MNTIKTLAAVVPTAAVAVALVAGCSTQETTPAAPTVTVTVAPTAPSTSTPSQVPSAPPTVTVTTDPAPAAFDPCSDDDLAVTNEPLQSANTLRHVVVSFTNTSSRPCTLVGYPGADLVTPVGGVLINVPRRPGDAPRHLVLAPGDAASAEIQAYAIDTATGDTCPRWGNVVVTPPNNFVSHSLSVDLPICKATVSPVD